MDRIGEVTNSTRFIGFRSNYFGWFTSEFSEFDVFFLLTRSMESVRRGTMHVPRALFELFEIL